jgi:hypothetical protein
MWGPVQVVTRHLSHALLLAQVSSSSRQLPEQVELLLLLLKLKTLRSVLLQRLHDLLCCCGLRIHNCGTSRLRVGGLTLDGISCGQDSRCCSTRCSCSSYSSLVRW